MASSLTHPSPLLTGLHHRPFQSNSPSPFQFRSRNPNPNPRFTAIASSSSSSPSSWDREEARWLREEQRWLREEQRWLREEQRWRSEREALILEIAVLRRRIEALERDGPSLEAVLVAPGGISGDRGSVTASASPQPLLVEEADVKEMVLEEVRVSESAVVVEKKREEAEGGKASPLGSSPRRRVLRIGAEGDDVKELQDALQKLGFYSGEEDMEFASFSSGTERAVKTWQASLGTPEDGIMTIELLEKLYMEQATVKDGTNGTAVASLKQVTEVQHKIIKESGDAEVNVSEHRVFLLGENRWEEPSRLVGRDTVTKGVKSAAKCLQCRGEGTLLCTECDGTGEPNVEAQFLEWVGEGSKCPYCEGLGYTICDVCEGKTILKT